MKKIGNTLRRAFAIPGAIICVLIIIVGFAAMITAHGEAGLVFSGVFMMLGGGLILTALFLGEITSRRECTSDAQTEKKVDGESASTGSGSSCKDIYLRHMDENGIRYRDVDERIVDISYSAKNAGAIQIRVIFDPGEGRHVHFYCGNIGPFQEKAGEAILLCNAMNMHYRWANFYLDQENSVVVDADLIVTRDTVGRACVELVERLVSIVDEAYPEFMKVKWGGE